MSEVDDRQRVLEEFTVSQQVAERLDILVAELGRWQTIKNLVGPSTLQQVWPRHIADSLQLARLAPEAKAWLDLGSGAGFPGLVLAILGAEAGFRVTLVESNARKCAFLRHVARLTGAAATIHAERLEAVMPQLVGKVDVVTARALAPLQQLLAWNEPLFEGNTIGLFPKGRDVASELAEAEKMWSIDYDVAPSHVDPESCIVRVAAAKRLAP